jgi:hypothetical protein
MPVGHQSGAPESFLKFWLKINHSDNFIPITRNTAQVSRIHAKTENNFLFLISTDYVKIEIDVH